MMRRLFALRWWIAIYLVFESFHAYSSLQLRSPKDPPPRPTSRSFSSPPIVTRSSAPFAKLACASGERVYYFDDGVLRAVGPTAWERSLAEHDYDYPKQCAADEEGRVYVPVRDKYGRHGGPELRVFDADGRLLWSAPTSGRVDTLALGGAGEVVISSELRKPRRRYLEKLSEGESLWRIETADQVRAIGSDGTIYCKRHQGTLVARQPDGVERFAASPTTADISSPAFDGAGNIYLSDYHGLFALDQRGVLRWKRTAAEPWLADSEEGTALIGANVPGSKHEETQPAVSSDGTVYFAARSLFAFTSRGELKWQFTPETLYHYGGDEPTYLDRTPILAQDGTLYVTTYDGQLYALSSAGEPLWRESGARYEQLTGLHLSPPGELEVVRLRTGVERRRELQLIVFDTAGHGPLMRGAWPTQFHDFGNSRRRPAE